MFCGQLATVFEFRSEVADRAVEIGIAADRPSHVPNDDREFGFAFGVFEIK